MDPDWCRSVPVQMGPTAPKSDPTAFFVLSGGNLRSFWLLLLDFFLCRVQLSFDFNQISTAFSRQCKSVACVAQSIQFSVSCSWIFAPLRFGLTVQLAQTTTTTTTKTRWSKCKLIKPNLWLFFFYLLFFSLLFFFFFWVTISLEVEETH